MIKFIILKTISLSMASQGVIFDIKKYAIHDGPGIRTTIFFKGCPMDCWWCHNPESQKKEPEPFSNSLRNNSQNLCVNDGEIIGRNVSVREVMEEIKKDIVFYEESEGGVSFSGGEPLMQKDFLNELLINCKKNGLHTTLDTAGCASKEIILQIAPNVDLFLYDLKLIDDKKHQKYTGISNKEILENLLLLSELKHNIVIRIPIVPTINDSEEDIADFGKFIQKVNIIRVDLLPYHIIGEEKYRKLKKVNRMKEIVPPSKERIEEIKKQLETFNLNVSIEV